MVCRIIFSALAALSLHCHSAEQVALSGTSGIEKRLNVFVLTQSMGYKHAVVARPAPGTLSVAEKAIVEIGDRTRLFYAECSQDATQLTRAKLSTLDALIFFTTGDLPLKPAEFAEIQSWLRGGKAFVGIHSATDTFKEFKPYYDMVGGTFLRHPWTHGGVIDNLDPKHPAVSMFPAQFTWGDELCEHQFFDPRRARVLLSLNIEKSEPKVTHAVPLCWVREYGKGRVFYTNFGNSATAWSDEQFRQHIFGGLNWALKRSEGSGEANTEQQAELDTRARLAVFSSEKSWLMKAARSIKIEPNVAAQAAEKLAKENKTAYLKAHDLILAARAAERAREATLRANQRPSEKEIEEVLVRRREIMRVLSAPQP